MLKLYDYLEAIMEEHNNRQWFYETKLNFFAGDVMETLDVTDAEEIGSSLNRVFQACGTLNIPVGRNFKQVYRFNGEALIEDWKISPLACYLIIINCNPVHERVAKAQLYFAMNQVARKI
jgi:hypothetical protein